MRHIGFVLVFLLLAGACWAQGTAQSATVSLQLSDVDITQALTTLSQQGGMAIVGDTTVKGKVSCSLSGVSAQEALDTLCKMNKLEWYKTYASPGSDQKISASKLFTLLDALKDLGGSAVICEDPKTQTRTVFVPGAGADSVDASALASGLKLKEVYLVRAIPDPEKAKADKAKAQQAGGKLDVPPTDPQIAAGQLWNYFNQMPLQQRFETMHQLRHLMTDNMTPEQQQQMRDMFRQQFGDRRGGPPGQGGQPGQGRPQRQGQDQGGGHKHGNQQ